MGILNLTPDSFSDGGHFCTPSAAVGQATRLLKGGAKLLDLGAESTRPGARALSPDEEWQRLETPLFAIRKQLPEGCLSLDTRHADTAAKGLQNGISILNDVCGFSSPAMKNLAVNSDCALLAMRSRSSGGAFLMPPYSDPTPKDAGLILEEMRLLKNALLSTGIAPERIVLDPGFGFGTTFREDLALWEALEQLPQALDWPASRICIAVSRKRFLAWRAGSPDLPPMERDPLSEIAHEQALRLGFRVIRSHQPPPVKIRPAQAVDLPAMVQVQTRSLLQTYQGVIPQAFLDNHSQTQKEQSLSAALQAAHLKQDCLVLERLGQVLGFTAMRRINDDAGEILAVCILPTVWRCGYGRRLLNQALQTMKTTGIRNVTLWVLERNEGARHFYESCHWRRDSEARTIWEDGIALRELRYRIDLSNLATVTPREVPEGS